MTKIPRRLASLRKGAHKGRKGAEVNPGFQPLASCRERNGGFFVLVHNRYAAQSVSW